MSNLSKTVQLATKPKRAAPKAKYIDPLVQATFNQDGALQEIVRTLSTRLRDRDTTVTFKSLIVLHQLLRAGSLEPTFSYLASSSLSQSLSSFEAPNLAAYGHYLAARIKSYSNIKRDVIRDKSDRRAAGRLRNLKVEQGLLRETREVQRMIAALVESKFYTDDVDDEVSMTALRFLVKDLLVLFTAVNEGVINVLEHYFEMSHPDATTALKIYKTFVRDTEKVVAYLGIARKLKSVTLVEVPNLKHAPVSLASSLEEYLNDPNFATNREEYKENKRIADGGAPKPKSTTTTTSSPSASTSAPAASTSTSAPATTSAAPSSFTDFFESIEAAQQPMFDSPAPNMQFFPQQQLQPQATGFNPFLQPQFTGMPFPPPQMTMMTGMGGPFGQPNPFGAQQTGFPQQQQMMQPQPTGFIQPQMTGAPNPFRQSMMMTGGGGGSPFGRGAFAIGGQQSPPPMPSGPFGQQQQRPMVGQPTGAGAFGNGGGPFGQQQQQQQQQPPSPFGNIQPPPTGAPFTSQLPPSSPFAPNRVASPFTASQTGVSSPPSPAPLTQQKTGARNPFAPAPGTVLPQPKAPQGPSMNAMATGAFGQQQQPQSTGQQNGQQQQQNGAGQPQQDDAFASVFSNGQQQQQQPAPLTQSKTGGLMANIGSEFAFSGHGGSSGASTINGNSTSNASTLSPFSSSPFNSSFTSSSTPFSSSFSSPSSPAPLTAQPTGFGGSTMKPFQPTSSFGSKLADELGPSSFASSSAFSAPPPSSAPTSPAPLTAQSTGAAFNPFRAGSVLPPLNGSLSAGLTGQQTGGAGGPFGAGGLGAIKSQPTGFQPTSAFGQSAFGDGAFGGQQQQGQQQQGQQGQGQQGGTGSLI